MLDVNKITSGGYGVYFTSVFDRPGKIFRYDHQVKGKKGISGP